MNPTAAIDVTRELSGNAFSQVLLMSSIDELLSIFINTFFVTVAEGQQLVIGAPCVPEPSVKHRLTAARIMLFSITKPFIRLPLSAAEIKLRDEPTKIVL